LHPFGDFFAGVLYRGVTSVRKNNSDDRQRERGALGRGMAWKARQ
jgi:hypothetical protein